MDELLLLRSVYNRVELPVWVFDVDTSHIIWANKSALELWDAKQLTDLLDRDMSTDMSPAVKQRLNQYLADFKKMRLTSKNSGRFTPMDSRSPLIFVFPALSWHKVDTLYCVKGTMFKKQSQMRFVA
jgi:hypothetical protein